MVRLRSSGLRGLLDRLFSHVPQATICGEVADSMMDSHINPRLLARLVDGEVSRAEAAKLLLHLQRCPICLAKFETQHPSQFEALWTRLLGDLYQPHLAEELSLHDHFRAREAEVRAANRAFASLCEMPVDKHRLVVRNSLALRSLAGVQCLLEESKDRWHRSPRTALHWSELALVALEVIPVGKYPLTLTADYTARAWGYSGNAKRQLSDLEGAGECFKKAEFWLALGTHEPLEEAALRRLQAVLARDCRNFSLALEKGQRALKLYREAGDKQHAAWLQVELAVTDIHSEELEIATQSLQAVLRSYTVMEVGSMVLVAALHNLAVAQVESGHVEDAAARLREARRLSGPEADLLVEARFDWIEARILAITNHLFEAEDLFRQVQTVFLLKEIPYDAALVSLDLAELLLRRGATAEVKDLAQDIVAIFHERGIHREARRAGLLLGRALLKEEATVNLVKSVARYLKLARNDPSYCFTHEE